MLIPSVQQVRQALYGCAIKLIRAHDHRNDLQTIHNELGASKYFTAEFDRDGEYRIARLKILAPLPPRIPCILGDLVHNARSYLDHLACVMVKAGGAPVTRDIQFPVCDTLASFQKSARKRLSGAPSGFVDFVETLQPFRTTGPNYLQLITELDNQDKHRDLLISAMLPSHIEFGANGPENSVRDIRFPSALSFPLKDGEELLRFWLSPEVSLDKLAIKIGFGAQLVFADPGPLQQVAVIPLMYSALKYLEEQLGNPLDQLLDTW